MARPRNRSQVPPSIALLAGLALGSGGTIVALDPQGTVLQLQDSAVAMGLVPGCHIKSKLRPHTRALIYHVPGQMFYSETIIRPEYGERWFCSEQDAITAGWQKARR